MFFDFKDRISVIANWPRDGITTYDIAPLLHDSNLFHELILQLTEPYQNQRVSTVVGIEARGFVLASAIAYQLHAGIALVRKKGKTPPPVISQEYSFEYASYVMEVAGKILQPDEHVILVDDILATGGTMAAAVKLINKVGSKIIGISIAIEMKHMAGRDRLNGQTIHSIISYI